MWVDESPFESLWVEDGNEEEPDEIAERVSWRLLVTAGSVLRGGDADAVGATEDATLMPVLAAGAEAAVAGCHVYAPGATDGAAASEATAPAWTWGASCSAGKAA